jgi:hypothetical protein
MWRLKVLRQAEERASVGSADFTFYHPAEGPRLRSIDFETGSRAAPE